MASLLRNRQAPSDPDPPVMNDPERWKRETINNMFKSKADAYDGAIDRAVLLIGVHANEQSPAEVIEIIKSLKTDAIASEV